MSNPPNTQSQKRFSESLASRFETHTRPDVLILKSSSDLGVIRNGGRNGTRFAPNSLLSFFKRLSLIESLKSVVIKEVEVADPVAEEMDFDKAQLKEAEKIKDHLKESSKAQIIHIGGGHDHIYPLLKSLGSNRIIVVNIDAHADTRTDSASHSGNPFRKFSQEHKDFHLFQIGLHPFANSESTLSVLDHSPMHILWRHEVNETAVLKLFQQIRALMTPETIVLLSIDADALDGSIVPGVSAVNGAGLSLSDLSLLWKSYRSLELSHAPIIGLYELNPLYDTLSGMSMRTVAGFLFDVLKIR